MADEKVERVLVYGEINGNLAFLKEDEARERAELWGALKSKGTWGEFKKRIGVLYEFEVVPALEEKWEGVREEIEGLELEESETLEEAAKEYDPSVTWLGVHPPDDLEFDPHDIPSYSDGKFPSWPITDMLFWVPDSIQKKYGTPASGLDYEGLEIPEGYEKEVVAAFRKLGWKCVREQKLVEAACGLLLYPKGS